jgi:hypothetical protein
MLNPLGLWPRLKGHRTQIGSVLGGGVVVAWSLGYLTKEEAGCLLGAIGALTGFALRASISDLASGK